MTSVATKGGQLSTSITKTCPCNIEIFSAVKMENLIGKILIFSKFMLKTLIVGTPYNRLGEGVLMSTRNLCFGSKIKIGTPLYTPVLIYRTGVSGVYISRTCFPDVLGLLSSRTRIHRFHTCCLPTCIFCYPGEPNVSGLVRGNSVGQSDEV